MVLKTTWILHQEGAKEVIDVIIIASIAFVFLLMFFVFLLIRYAV